MPTTDDELESEGQPALYSAPPGQDLDLDQDPPVVPTDRPMGATQYGTTAREGRIDEPLAARAARETPEVDEEGSFAGDEPDPVAARLMAPDSDVDEVDVTSEEVAFESESPEDDAGLSAEEAAMHVVSEDRFD